MGMFCTNCGKPRENDNAFCVHCGNSLGKVKVQEPVNAKPRFNITYTHVVIGFLVLVGAFVMLRPDDDFSQDLNVTWLHSNNHSNLRVRGSASWDVVAQSFPSLYNGLESMSITFDRDNFTAVYLEDWGHPIMPPNQPLRADVLFPLECSRDTEVRVGRYEPMGSTATLTRYAVTVRGTFEILGNAITLRCFCGNTVELPFHEPSHGGIRLGEHEFVDIVERTRLWELRQ